MQATVPAITSVVKVAPVKVKAVATVPVAKIKAVHHGVHLRLVVIHAMAWEHRQLRSRHVVVRFNPRNLKAHERYLPVYSHTSGIEKDVKRDAARALVELPDILDWIFDCCDAVIDAVKVAAMVLLALHVANVDMTDTQYYKLGIAIALAWRLYRGAYKAYDNRAHIAELYREYCARVEHAGMVK